MEKTVTSPKSKMLPCAICNRWRPHQFDGVQDLPRGPRLLYTCVGCGATQSVSLPVQEVSP